MNRNSRSFPIYAISNKTITWIIRIIALAWLVAASLLLFLLPITFAAEDGYLISYSRNPAGALIFIIVYESCFLFLCGWLLKYGKKWKNKAVVKMWVDGKGLHRQQKNGVVLSVLYNRLRSVPEEGNYDVYTRQIGAGKYSRTALMLNYMNEAGNITPIEVEFVMNVWYAFYPANMMELRAAFLQNVTGYKEIRINPGVYSYYHIDPVTFQFDAKKYWIQWAIVALLVISVGFLILWMIED